MPSPGDIVIAFPGLFDAVPVATVQSAIDRATILTPLSVFDDATESAILVLTAHFLTLNNPLLAAGGATTYQAGPVSTTFGGTGALGRMTGFLQQWIMFRNARVVRPIIPL